MPDFPPPPGLRAPGRPGVGPAVRLALPRRRDPAVEAPASVVNDPFLSRTGAPMVPFEGAAMAAPVSTPLARHGDLEKAMRGLEARLEERDHVIADLESKLAERERELAEVEALLQAREKVMEAMCYPSEERASASPEEQVALEALRAEIERQEATLKEARASLREREQFLEDSENRLFEKVQAQQEKESELEQREEDLRARERRLRDREAEHDPVLAARLAEEKARAATAYDEFNE